MVAEHGWEVLASATSCRWVMSTVQGLLCATFARAKTLAACSNRQIHPGLRLESFRVLKDPGGSPSLHFWICVHSRLNKQQLKL